MHDELWLTLLGLFGLLAIAVLMLPLTRRIGAPYTVFLAGLGIFIGLIIDLVSDLGLGIVSDLFRAFGSFGLSSETIILVFLPALVFESSLSIDVRRLLDDIGPILFLAVAGVLISAFLVGGVAWAASTMPFVVCLLLGAIVSATDPVAVVAIFKDLGAPKRLGVLVEGESLFNDATAIVLFNIVAAMLLGTTDPSLVGGLADFLVVFLGGVAVGLAIARGLIWLVAHLRCTALVEVTLSISLAYVTFLLAEHYLHVSGVMATVTAALVIGAQGRTAISAEGWHLLTQTWDSIGFWANSLIFVLVGIAVPEILSALTAGMAVTLVAVILGAAAARGALTHLLLPLMAAARLSAPVPMGYRMVMWWGGLRGAVSLALALSVYESTAFPDEVRAFIVALVCGLVLFTLFVSAPSVGLVLRAFGLDRLTPVELAIRNRIIGQVLGRIAAGLPGFARGQEVAPEIAARLRDAYLDRTAESRAAAGDAAGPTAEDWMRAGLMAVLGRERRGYLDHYAAGDVEPAVARELLAVNDEVLDQTRAGGRAGWERACERAIGFDRPFRLALLAQRRLGLDGPLSRRVAARYERLRIMLVVLLDISASAAGEIGDLVGSETASALQQRLKARIARIETAITAIRLQYPDYAAALDRFYLESCAIRQERASYARLNEEAMIGAEVHRSLEAGLEERVRALSARPRLDLGLTPVALIARVPLFVALDGARQQAIARLLRPELAIPGERIIRRGDPGDSMYFVSSGALRVDVPPKPVVVGSGGFVGEMALLSEAPRAADVEAIGFCDLLVLDRRDFHALLAIDPHLQQTIEQVAADRLRQLSGE